MNLAHRLTLAALGLCALAIASCDDDPTAPTPTPDPNLVVEVPLYRQLWTWASLPVRGPSVDGAPRAAFAPVDRAYAGWHRTVPLLQRGDLEPGLDADQASEEYQTLELRVIARDSVAGWDPGEFAGIMLGMAHWFRVGDHFDWTPGAVDLTGARFLELWIDDGTGYVDPTDEQALRAARPGRLHIDFGSINEDFWWGPDGTLGEFDTEDLDEDGRLSVAEDGWPEDRGLDGLRDPEESVDQAIYGRPSPGSYDPAGDKYDVSDPGDHTYPYINGTEENQRLDTEDLSQDGSFDLADGFLRLTLELDDPDPLIDPSYIYADRPEFIAQWKEEHRSWRLYLLDLRDAITLARGADTDDGTPYTATAPDLSQVKMLRIWYEPEGDGSDPPQRRIKLAGLRFVRSPRP